MYLINTQIESKDASYPEDFPMLKNGSKFAMEKQGEDYIIQTIEFDDKKLVELIQTREREILVAEINAIVKKAMCHEYKALKGKSIEYLKKELTYIKEIFPKCL